MNHRNSFFKYFLVILELIVYFYIKVPKIGLQIYPNIPLKSTSYYSKRTNKLIKKQILIGELIKIFSDLYDYSRNGYRRPIYSNISNKYAYKGKNINICICTIGKNENLYAKEFAEYYYNLGIDKIIIYDNNDIEGENFEDILSDYIKIKFIEIIDVRGLSSIQIPIYNYCYRKNKLFYDWIGFLDFDEYLNIINNNSIKSFFYKKRFCKCQAILFNLVFYNDNNLIEYENVDLNKRFTNLTFYSSMVKSFVRGSIQNIAIPTTHLPGINVFSYCNSKGEFIYPNSFIPHLLEKNPEAYIKHFYSKTVKEFCFKLQKSNAHFHKKHHKYNTILKEKIKLFFKLNEMTKEKIKILEKCSNKKLNDLNLSILNVSRKNIIKLQN